MPTHPRCRWAVGHCRPLLRSPWLLPSTGTRAMWVGLVLNRASGAAPRQRGDSPCQRAEAQHTQQGESRRARVDQAKCGARAGRSCAPAPSPLPGSAQELCDKWVEPSETVRASPHPPTPHLQLGLHPTGPIATSKMLSATHSIASRAPLAVQPRRQPAASRRAVQTQALFGFLAPPKPKAGPSKAQVGCLRLSGFCEDGDRVSQPATSLAFVCPGEVAAVHGGVAALPLAAGSGPCAVEKAHLLSCPHEPSRVSSAKFASIINHPIKNQPIDVFLIHPSRAASPALPLPALLCHFPPLALVPLVPPLPKLHLLPLPHCSFFPASP